MIYTEANVSHVAGWEVTHGGSHTIIEHISTADNKQLMFWPGFEFVLIEFRRPHSLEHVTQF